MYYQTTNRPIYYFVYIMGLLHLFELAFLCVPLVIGYPSGIMECCHFCTTSNEFAMSDSADFSIDCSAEFADLVWFDSFDIATTDGSAFTVKTTGMYGTFKESSGSSSSCFTGSTDIPYAGKQITIHVTCDNWVYACKMTSFIEHRCVDQLDTCDDGYLCSDYQCLDDSWVCDGDNDCGSVYGEDEFGCPGAKSIGGGKNELLPKVRVDGDSFGETDWTITDSKFSAIAIIISVVVLLLIGGVISSVWYIKRKKRIESDDKRESLLSDQSTDYEIANESINLSEM